MADGVWRTVRGRRIFIAEGQDLQDAMANSGKFQEKKWDYRGIDESVKKIEDGVDNVKGHNQAVSLRIAIDAQENIINRYLDEIKQGIEKGDETALMTYRRRLRTARKRLLDKKQLG